MRLNVEDEHNILSYLLGDLAEAEQALVEVRFMKDAEYLETIRAIEDDLIDDYVTGEMPAEQRERFEKYLTIASERRKKIEVARALQTVLAAETPPLAVSHLAEPSESWWKSLTGSLRAHRLAFQYSLVAALMVVTFIGLWLFIDHRRQRAATESAQTQIQTSPPQDQISKQDLASQQARERERMQNEELAKQKSDEQQRQFEQQAREAARKPAMAQPVIASFFLSPGSLREGTESTSLTVPHAARLVRLNLYLPNGVDFKRYRAELRTAGGSLILSRNGLSPKSTAAGKALTLQIPAGVLVPGEYEVTLAGVVSKQNLKNVSSYDFSIAKK
jgi:hypothetical protein